MRSFDIDPTAGLSPHEIVERIRNGRLRVCPRERLRLDEIEQILDAAMRRYAPNGHDPGKPMALRLSRLGFNRGEPVMSIGVSATDPDGTIRDVVRTISICACCPRTEGRCAYFTTTESLERKD